ncbi:MAG: hypothetical protein COA69_00515 [Robiginitomaculum sp.]|nr:MAG: hypothetical protein COA69_00515 [Robiginitomaculum sp.]
MPDMLSFTAFILQFCFYATSLGLVGLLLCQILSVGPRNVHIPMVLLAGFGMVFYVGSLALSNAKMGGGFAAMFEPDSFVWVWRIHKTQALLLGVGLAVVILNIALKIKGAALLAALLLSASFGSVGHVQALESPGILPWVVGLHVLVAGFWVVAPFVLWPRSDVDKSQFIQGMEGYSAVAKYIIPVLFVAGLFLAWILAGGIEGLLTQPYGQLLVLKLGLVSLVLGLGAYNKIVVTAKLKHDYEQGQLALKRTLSVDIALFVLVLGVIAWATTITGTGSH